MFHNNRREFKGNLPIHAALVQKEVGGIVLLSEQLEVVSVLSDIAPELVLLPEALDGHELGILHVVVPVVVKVRIVIILIIVEREHVHHIRGVQHHKETVHRERLEDLVLRGHLLYREDILNCLGLVRDTRGTVQNASRQVLVGATEVELQIVPVYKLLHK